MKFLRKSIAVLLIGIFYLGVVSVHFSAAITIKEEEELSREFLSVVSSSFEIIDDPMIVKYINVIGKKILTHFPQQPFAYHFYVIKEDVYNAFATPAGHIFIYTGLIAAMDDEDELAGILGHEIAHVYCRHISQKIERSKRVNMATLAGVAAGIFLGVAGAGEAAGAVTMGSLAAGQSAMLAYSREDEVQADQVGLEYLMQSGYDGEGLLKVLNKIRAKQWYGTDQVPSYLMTHPAVEDRLAYIDTYLEKTGKNKTQEKVATSQEFKIFKARIVALYSDEKVALNKFNATLDKNPADPVANYGIGLALARVNRRQEALEHLKKALSQNAFDPVYLSALGRVYFMDGRYEEALSTLKSAVSVAPDNAEALFYLGRAQLELNQLQDAENTFETLLKNPPVSKQVDYFIGKTYGLQGNLADAHYHLGLYYLNQREYQSAHIQLTKALELTQDPERRQKIENLLKQAQAMLSKTRKRSG